MKPAIGEMAPDFNVVGVSEKGESHEVRLADYRGQRVVLVFYPKDATPGCTQQACAIRDGWSQLEGRAKVFGVSVDPVKSHGKFIAKEGLPYTLLADEEHRMVEAYGVWVEKSMYGRKSMGTERSTFVIGPDGQIEAVLEKVSAKTHFDDLLAILEKLEAGK
ncbi:MAG: peroxiredoxin [Akkermansiaceae bacterium]|jgi:peroxiredoxin Q/BCP|nr:peroxiredoxin [Akkermansiaceae bacterium]